MLINHIEDLLGEATAIDVVVLEGNGNKAAVVDDASDELL